MTKQELLELYNKSFYTNGGNGSIYFLSYRKQKMLYDLVFSNKKYVDIIILSTYSFIILQIPTIIS